METRREENESKAAQLYEEAGEEGRTKADVFVELN